ncbi:hypothetical protein NKH18_23755 [Streptomyces sp. M10(2022)]
MTTVELTEYGPPVTVPLADEVGRSLAASRIVEAAPIPTGRAAGGCAPAARSARWP